MPKAEEHFIKALTSVIGNDSIIVHPNICIPADYRRQGYSCQNIFNCFNQALQFLGSDMDFARAHGPKVDAFINNHHPLGSRIVEFDEEQHFNIFREYLLNSIGKYIDLPFQNRYIGNCSNANYLARMLRKTRIINSIATDDAIQIESFKSSLIQLCSANKYIAPTHGFPFAGGRMVQRAYYDTLKDALPYSNRFTHLSGTLRFSIFEFEEESNKSFLDIHIDELKLMIAAKLQL